MIRKLFLIFLTCSLFSCNSDDKVTKQLGSYLDKQFSIALPTSKSYYVLVPATQCPACVHFDGSLLPKPVLEKTTIISDFNHKHFNGFPHYYYDTTSALQRLAILEYSSKIFVVEKGKVLAVVPVTDLYDQLDSLEKQK